MYEFILYNRGSSHMITGDSLKLEDYPGIEPGTLAFDVNSEKIFIAIEDEFVEVAAAAEETPEVEEVPEVDETPAEGEGKGDQEPAVNPTAEEEVIE
jgi:hypothetical protein